MIAQSHYLTPQEIITRISRLQSITLPFKPEIKNIQSIYYSFNQNYDFYEEDTFSEMHNLLQSLRYKLNNLTIKNINFSPILDSSRGLIYDPYIFKSSNFENSELWGSMLIGLNLTYSNFSKTRISTSRMDKCALLFCNFERADINDINMTKAILDYSNMSYTNLANTTLFSASLLNTNLTHSFINQNDFQYAILLGTDFSNAIIFELNDFRNAFYNSKELNYEKHYDSLATFSSLLSKIHDTQHMIGACNVMLHHMFSCNIKPTQFPEGFNPKEQGMIDVSEIIEFINQYKREELYKYKKNKRKSRNQFYSDLNQKEDKTKRLFKKSINDSIEAYRQLLENIKIDSL